jgi:hypothetical protein
VVGRSEQRWVGAAYFVECHVCDVFENDLLRFEKVEQTAGCGHQQLTVL